MSAPRLWHRCISLHRSDAGAVGLLVAIFFGLNLRLLTGEYSEQWDGEIFFAPFYHHVATLARDGQFLYWNPFCSGGSPDFAEPQIGAFSPVTLLFGLLVGPGAFGFHLYWLCLWLLGGLGMYVLARSLSAPPWGALVTGLGFVLSGFYLGHGEHLSVVYTYSFVPWILWRVRTAMLSGRRWPACGAGALWGLSALAGNPAVHIPAAMFVGVIALAWLPGSKPGTARWTPWRTYLMTMALFAGVGCIVLAPAYIGFAYEAAGYSHRTNPLPRAIVVDGRFGWSWLTALATPFLVTLDDTMPAWADFDISMRPIYFGAVIPIFAAFASWRQRARWRTWLVFATGLLSLAMAMGATLPLRGWLYDYLPPTRFFRHAPMFRGFFILAMAMLAASGTASIDARLRRHAAARALRPLLIVAVACALLSVTSCVVFARFLSDEIWAQLPLYAPVHLTVVWLSPVILCAAAMHWPHLRRWLPGSFVALTILDLAVAHVTTNRLTFQHQSSVVATAPILPLSDLGAVGFKRAALELTNASLYNHQPVFMSYTAMRNESQVAWARDEHLRQFAIGPERVFFAANVPTVPANEQAYAFFAKCCEILRTLLVVRHTRDSLIHPDIGLARAEAAAIMSAPPAQSLAYQLLAYHANDLSLRVECPSDGYLLLTDRWSRSWKATVNGSVVPIEGGDFLFRLVPVQAGSNTVVMQFQVAWVKTLVALSWGTLVIIAGGSAWFSYRKKKMTASAIVGIRPAHSEPVLVPAS